MTSSFTAEDERFAYKRARSRLWERCGTRWHSEPDLWTPSPQEIRRWERSSPSSPATPPRISSFKGHVKLGQSYELDKLAVLQEKELGERESVIAGPFREK